MDEIVTQPLVLQRKSRSSRFASFSGEANTFRDKFLRSFYVFLLVALDFIMLIYSINGRLFEGGEFNQALLVIFGATFIFAFVVIMLLSFSKNMQNVFCALMTMIITAAFFYQFALNDVNNFLEVWFDKHMSWLSFFCIIPSPWLVGLFFGVLIFFLFRFSDAILFVTMVLLFSGLIGVQKNEFLSRQRPEYEEVSHMPGDAGVNADNSLIYFMIPKLPSYQYLNAVKDINFREVRDLLLGFYATNGFEIYPNAFIQNNDEMSNVIDIFNQVDYMSATSSNRGFAEFVNEWDFIHGGLEKYSLEENKLYDYLESYGYGVSMYSMPGFNFCLRSGAFATDRCVIKGYKNVSLYDKNATVEKNLYTLLGEWILSLKSRDLKSVAKMFFDMSPLKNMKVISENRRVSIEGSSSIFAKISNDYVRDQGGQAYIAYIDLPSDIYIYDEYCNIKPRKDWVALKDNSLYAGGIDAKRKGYADQTKCLIGKLQEFMDNARQSAKYTRTDIYIQGLSTIRELAGVRGDEYHQFITDNLVNLAIRKGKKPRFLINANICLASDFTKSLIKYQDYCYTLDNIKRYNGKSLNLKKNLINNSVIRGSKISNIMARYKDWLELYQANNRDYVERKQREQKKLEKRLKREREEKLREQRQRAEADAVEEQKSRSQNDANIFVPNDDPVPFRNDFMDDDFGFDESMEDIAVPEVSQAGNLPEQDSTETTKSDEEPKDEPAVENNVEKTTEEESVTTETAVVVAEEKVPESSPSEETLEVKSEEKPDEPAIETTEEAQTSAPDSTLATPETEVSATPETKTSITPETEASADKPVEPDDAEENDEFDLF